MPPIPVRLGLMKLTSEGGVAAGVRRLEGVTGLGVLALLDEKEVLLQKTAEVLKTNPNEIVHKAQSLNDSLKESRREIDQLKSRLAKGAVSDIESQAEEVGGVKVIANLLDDGMDMNTLREIGDNLKKMCQTL